MNILMSHPLSDLQITELFKYKEKQRDILIANTKNIFFHQDVRY